MYSNEFESREDAIDLGKDYEFVMAAYLSLLLSLDDEVANFHISTNNELLGDFDDVVIEMELENGDNHVIAIQLKHIQRPIQEISLTNTTGNFSLWKYCKEFAKIRKKISLEKFHFVLFTTSTIQDLESIEETGRRLKTGHGVNQKASEIKIYKKSESLVKKLLYIDNDFIYEFRTDIKDSIEADFFAQFSLFTKQKTVRQIEDILHVTIVTKFENCSSHVVLNYVTYFKHWCRSDYGCYKLTKQDVRLKLAEFLLAAHIPKPKLPITIPCNEEKSILLQTAIQCFDITTIPISGESQDLIDKTWAMLLVPYGHIPVGWTQQLPQIYLDEVPALGDIPLAAHGNDYNELTMERIYITTWHKGLSPLFIKCDPNRMSCIKAAIELCQNKGLKKKFILMGTNLPNFGPPWTIFQNLSQLYPLEPLYQDIVQKFTISLRDEPQISLQLFTMNSQDLIEAVTVEELVQMLDGTFCIDAKGKNTKPYINRSTPKIYLNERILYDTRDDLFVVSFDGTLQQFQDKFPLNAIELEKYFLMRMSANSAWYTPKQFTISLWQKLTRQQRETVDNFIILSQGLCDRDNFNLICAKNPGRNCHHLHFMDDKIEWMDSRGCIDKLKPYKENGKDFVKDYQLLGHFTTGIHLICADSGMGKSTIFLYLKQQLQDYWLIIIDLKQHVQFFRQHHSMDELLQYILQHEGQQNHFVANILKILAPKKKILLLWDSFDEIPQSCAENLIGIINQLTWNGYPQWIASRLSSRTLLENALNTFALTISEFSTEDQYTYIYNSLKDNCQDLDLMVDRLHMKITRTLGSGELNYCRIPLHLHMFMEVINKNPEAQIDVLPDIYAEFIKGKFDCTFAKAEADLDNYYMEQILEGFQYAMMEEYEVAAIKVLFPQEVSKDLKLDCSQFCEDFADGDIVGIVVGMDDQKPIFTHKTYEEFFAASWLSKNYHKCPKAIELLFKEEYRNTRLMFDMILARNSPVHLAILYKNLEVLKQHQDIISNSKDQGGRNALHIACAWGNSHPLVALYQTPPFSLRTTINPSREEMQLFNLMCKHSCWNKVCDLDRSLLEPLQTNPERYAQMFNELITNDHKSELKYHVIMLNLSRHLCGKIAVLLGRNWRQNRPNNRKPSAKDAILINVENTAKISDSKIYIEIIDMLLEYCNPFEEDKLLKWSSVDYADQTLSLAAIDRMLNKHNIEIKSLQKFSHTPTVLHYAMSFNYQNLLNSIEETPLVEYEDSGYNLLELAIENNNEKLAEKLLKTSHYQKLVNTTTFTHSAPAAYHGNLFILELLLQHGAKINGFKIPPLYAAVFGRHLKCAEYLIKQGAKINEICYTGQSCLLMAAMQNDITIMRLLLSHGADVNYTHNNIRILEYCIKNNSIEAMELLIQHDVDLNKCCKQYGQTPLHKACIMGNVATVKCLLAAGANPAIKCKMNHTPLHSALMLSKADLAKELLMAQPSVINEYSKSLLSPMILASGNNLPDLVEMLAEFGADVNSAKSPVPPIWYAVDRGYIHCTKALIEAGANVNQINADGNIPLFAAIKDIEMLRLLLHHGANVKFKHPSTKTTALHHAAMNGHSEIVEELLKKRIDVNAKALHGITALHVAIEYKHSNIVRILLEFGAEIGDSGSEFLCHAARTGDLATISHLLHYGVDINAADAGGGTPLIYAIVTMNEGCIKPLLEAGADPTISGASTLTPLQIAIICSRSEALKQFLEAGLDVNQTNALHLSANLGDIATLILLIQAGADVNLVNSSKQSPLHLVAQAKKNYSFLNKLKHSFKVYLNKIYKVNDNFDECLRELIVNGANVNAKDANGRSPIHLAALNGNFNLVKLLAENGAQIDVVDNDGATPLDVAGEHPAVIEYLASCYP